MITHAVLFVIGVRSGAVGKSSARIGANIRQKDLATCYVHTDVNGMIAVPTA